MKTENSDFLILKLRDFLKSDPYFFRGLYVIPDPKNKNNYLICLIQLEDNIWMSPVILDNEDKSLSRKRLLKDYYIQPISKTEQEELQTTFLCESL